jgi:hypothetical protein
MKHILLSVIVLTLAATPVLGQKVTFDYDQNFDFASVETFRLVDTVETNAPDQLTHDRIRYAIIRELAEAGLTSASCDADLDVTYHLLSADTAAIDTASFGDEGVAPGWSASAGRTPSSTTSGGALVIDASDPDDATVVWRGTGRVNFEAKPEKQRQQIEKILAKLGKRWEKLLAGRDSQTR